MSDHTYYSQAEATAKIGRLVRTRLPLFRVPAGTTGRVVRADPGRDGWNVGIEWHLPRDPRQIDSPFAGEPFQFLAGGPVVVDWYSRSQYEQWFDEIATGVR